ncbi:hypothetical protein [Heliorestis convoluta]|uniref:Uncharacterized protein n=1 Tax=Heliorestis convoluta TaxID=356322 RepID=A0A5Q2N4C2_9FIRM|nr:hypothetical protein [Heliorestis convoluta]QGG48446.1 hypothetical protein FTV88_2348 [Heliorestis convoluta]
MEKEKKIGLNPCEEEPKEPFPALDPAMNKDMEKPDNTAVFTTSSINPQDFDDDSAFNRQSTPD